jgi:hypothetical protein
MKTTWLLFGLVGLAWTASGCAVQAQEGDDVGSQSEGTTTQYVNLVDFNDSEYQFVWPDIEAKLTQEFNDVCGDTFCEGDFSNLTPLRLSCSVTSINGTVHDCVWTFAGSLESVNPHTAAITVDAPTFQCHFHPKYTTTPNFVALLQNSTDAIHETLPHTTGSIYDELVDCFQHPIGATPITFDTTPPLTYVEASDYYTSPTWQAKWANSKAALLTGFNNVCGDTFCESDYSDMQSMAFVCAITKSTGNVKDCAWVLSGSYYDVATNGADVATSTSWNCPVHVQGTLSQLITTLTASGTTAPIDRLLPGTTASAYDALAGCLP